MDRGSTIAVTNNVDKFYFIQLKCQIGISPHWDMQSGNDAVTTCHDEGSKTGKPFYVLWTCIMYISFSACFKEQLWTWGWPGIEQNI